MSARKLLCFFLSKDKLCDYQCYPSCALCHLIYFEGHIDTSLDEKMQGVLCSNFQEKNCSMVWKMQ